MGASDNFDLIVIGCGPAGEKAGAQAAYFGKRVAVIESAEHMGGSCINTGTVPSKTLRESALYFSGLKQRGLYGIDYSTNTPPTTDSAISPATNCARGRICRGHLPRRAGSLGARRLDAAFTMRKIGNTLLVKRAAQPAAAALSTFALVAIAALFASCAQVLPSADAPIARYYLGFDRNIYPGDDAMKVLRKDFAFTGYWLSAPPGEKTNTWAGKRELLRSQGFGFLVLYRGRDSSELKKEADAKSMGARDAEEATAVAKGEHFSSATIIFLDIEEGGRLPETYHLYLATWSDTLTHAGYRAGVYCSGIPVKEEPGVSITTADDIQRHAAARELATWAYNDACPPSPGCTFPQNPPAPARSGISYAAVWQFVRSPRDKQTAIHCSGYSRNGNCYAAGDTAHAWFLDVNTAKSSDPSGGAR